MEINLTKLAVLCVFGLLMLSACGKSEERDKLVGATYEVQTLPIRLVANHAIG